MSREYTPDELLQSLRQEGARLMTAFFQPDPDTNRLIKNSVASNTFRGFAKLRPGPAEVYRGWANQRMSFAEVARLGEVATQTEMDELVELRFRELATYWSVQTRQQLSYGPGHKLVNLLHKAIIRDTGVAVDGRARTIPFLHVPHDKLVLTAVRQTAVSGLYGPPMLIPSTASMGFIESAEQYLAFQLLMRGIAAAAGVAPICIDLLAWDYAKGL